MEPVRSPKLAPYLVVKDANGLVKFLESGLEGKAGFRMTEPGGRVAHAEVLIGDSLVMLGESPASGRLFPGMVHLYVKDAIAAHARAVKAGATSVQEPARAPDGDVRGGVRDAWGNEWWFTTLP